MFVGDINAWLESKFGRLQCDPHFSEYVELFKRMLLAKEPKDMLVELLKILFNNNSYIYYTNKFLYKITYNTAQQQKEL